MRLTLMALGMLIASGLQVSAQGLTRTELQKLDYPEGHVTQSYLVTIPAQGMVPRHVHPGVEMGYLVSGTGTVTVDGQPERVLKPGDSWAFPAGVPHALHNTSDAPEQIVVTYVLEKGKPLASPAP